MALTDQSDIFASVTEDGFNRFAEHIMRKRPSLFNYGTQLVADNWQKLMCRPPDVAPEVLRHANPVVTVEDPLPLLGTNGLYGLNFGIQLTKLRLDLFPQGDALPPELGTLQDQQFSLTVEVCAGLGCPDDRTLEQLPPAPYPPFRPVDKEGRDNPDHPNDKPDDAPKDPPRPDKVITFPTRRLQCWCLTVVVVGHFEATGPEGDKVVEARLDGLEIVDIAPEGLEANLECYLKLLMRYVLLPRLRIAMAAFHFGILDGLAQITLSPTTTVPHNPAVEDDMLKLFVDVEVGP